MNQEISSTAMDDEAEDSAIGDSPFSLMSDDLQAIKVLISALRSLLTRPDLTPCQISRIGVFLFGLQRLPYPTPGISMTLDMTFKRNQESDSLGMHLDEERFTLKKSFVSYDPRAGSDYETYTVLEAGYRWHEGDIFETMDFAENFAQLATDPTRIISLSDNTDEPFHDWDIPHPTDT